MPAWITLQPSDLQDVMSEPIWAQYNSAAIQGNVGAKLTTIFADAINETQGYVQGNPANTIGAAGTIPPECRNATLMIIKLRVFGLVPNFRMFMDEARKDAEEATAFLKSIAKGIMRVSRPDEAAPEAPQGGAQVDFVPNYRRNRDERGDLHGL